eukprot:jgi/Bigna1/58123/fgenesh1_pm.55_\
MVAAQPTLVAVSKMKPSEAVKEAYDLGHRHFGENYVQELVKKSKELPKDIKWHFIGHLQSNKARHVVGIENLHMLETLDSVKLANIVNRISGEMDKKLKVLVQVNTSGESQKYGVSPADCVAMVKHVIENCQNLIFSGLMTIGDYSAIPKPDCFERLNACKTKVEKELGVDMSKKEMSMGMSADFELAIKLGSTSVRVGSALFGARDYSKKKK